MHALLTALCVGGGWATARGCLWDAMLMAYFSLRLWSPSEQTFLAFPLPNGLTEIFKCVSPVLTWSIGVSIHVISRLRKTSHPGSLERAIQCCPTVMDGKGCAIIHISLFVCSYQVDGLLL